MRTRYLLYWTIGVCIIVVVLGLIIRENIWEIRGPINPLSWGQIFISFIEAILLVLLGGSMVLDHWYLLDVLGEYLNFYPSVIMFRLAGVLLLLVGLLLLGVVVENVLAALNLIPNPYNL